MAIDFTTLWPYSEIKEVTVDGQKMVRIPRIYVKNVVLEGGTYKGKPAYFMSKEKLDGYHVHPAFMNVGSAASALDLSCYEASKDSSGKPASVSTTTFWQDINRDGAIAACDKRNVSGGTADQQGWHCWDIYCQHLLARLMLFEYGTTCFSFPESGSPDFVYRGIHQPAGNPTTPTWLPGLGNIGDKMYIYGNDGRHSMINTGVACPGNGWPKGFLMTKSSIFDLGDIFLASAVSSSENDGTCSDWQRLARNGVGETGYFTGYRGENTQDPANAHGMFAISQATYGSHSGYGSPSAYYGGGNGSAIGNGPLRFRLAHFVA